MAMSETTSIFYDTHAAVRQLTTAGMPEPHAEAVVRGQVHLIQHNLATKADIEQIRADVETSRLETKAEIEKLRLETNASIDVLREETKANTETAKNDIVKWIVTMGLAAVVALAGLAVAVVRHI